MYLHELKVKAKQPRQQAGLDCLEEYRTEDDSLSPRQRQKTWPTSLKKFSGFGFTPLTDLLEFSYIT
jgi:hypothetical protein